MKNPQVAHNVFTIQIETQTPVSVGDGRILSPYTDFVFDKSKEQIHVLDKKKIIDRIFDLDAQKEAEERSLMTEYMDGIYESMDNNRADFDLHKFMEAKLSLVAADNASQTIAKQGLRGNKKQEIKCMVKDNNRAYIPGSTLKGAIKGALLYDWFLNEGYGTFSELMREVLKVFQKCKRDIERIERIASRNYLSRHDKQEIKHLKKQISRKGGREISQQIQAVIDDLLTKDDNWFPRAFSQLKPKDSERFKESETIVQQVNRLHYNKGVVTIPVNLESIQKKAETTFKLVINPTCTRREFAFLNKADAVTTLFERINKFHKDTLDMELDLLDTGYWHSKARGEERTIFLKHKHFLEDLYDKVDTAPPTVAYMCVGFGKSFFYNSIGVLVNDWDESQAPEDLREEDKSLFRKYCQLFFLGKDGQKSFPLTRSVTELGETMGWIKLSV